MTKIVVDRNGKVKGDVSQVVGYSGERVRVIQVIHPHFDDAIYELIYRIRDSLYVSKLNANGRCVLQPSIIGRAGRIDMQFAAKSIDNEVVFKSEPFQLIVPKSLSCDCEVAIPTYEDALDIYQQIEEMVRQVEDKQDKIPNPTFEGIVILDEDGNIQDSGVIITTATPNKSSTDKTVPTSKAVYDALKDIEVEGSSPNWDVIDK